jgi:hypothetical protein
MTEVTMGVVPPGLISRGSPDAVMRPGRGRGD